MLWLGWHKKELWKPYFHCGPLRTGYKENIISDLPKVLKAKFLGRDEHSYLISICKFCSFNNPFATSVNFNRNSFTKFTSSSRSSMRIVISYAMKRASHWKFDGKSMEAETTTWLGFPNGEKAILGQNTSIRRKK